MIPNKPWRGDIDKLPHRQGVSFCEHFNDVRLLELLDNISVDLLIGKDNAFLMTVLEKRVEMFTSDPHA